MVKLGGPGTKKYLSAYFTRTLGIQMTLLQCMCTAFSSLFVSYIHTITPVQITIARLTFQLFVCIPILLYTGDEFWPKRQYFYTITFRSVCSTVGITALIYALAYIPISDANAISRTSPIYVTILGRLFLGEKIMGADVLLLLITLIGVGFITKPSFVFGRASVPNPYRNTGIAYALGSAVALAISMVSIKRANTPLGVNMFNFSVVGLAMLLTVGTSFGHFKSVPGCSGSERLYLFLAAVCGVLSQILLYLGLKHENAGVVASLSSTAILYTLLLQIVCLKQIPEWNSFLGAAIIMITITVYGLRKWSMNRPRGPVISKFIF